MNPGPTESKSAPWQVKDLPRDYYIRYSGPVGMTEQGLPQQLERSFHFRGFAPSQWPALVVAVPHRGIAHRLA